MLITIVIIYKHTHDGVNKVAFATNGKIIKEKKNDILEQISDVIFKMCEELNNTKYNLVILSVSYSVTKL